ncbi:PREDICTED: F-box protein SKIP27-like [Ipomoea nil]|uniref:F-box protein SKIP27-like n=1 Tax=Ipomoea nil TaxID=35883 RepID=UPI0009011DBF|nr:PREDICTED: F-box protein SKIP27-like [Ipomoea nil]
MEVAGLTSITPTYKSALEALPQDILIRIVCGVDHDDLRALFHVSKTLREVTLVAKKLHFEYSTPKKMVHFWKNDDDDDDFGEFNNDNNGVVVAAPNAPKHLRVTRSRLISKKLAGISVALFASEYGGAVKWQCNKQFLQMASPGIDEIRS